MSCGEQCISGFVHEGKPSGELSFIKDVKYYVATPENPTPEKAILIFPDVFGIELKNTQLIADRLAMDLNITTYLVDTFSGDSMPEPGKPLDVSIGEWLRSHGPERVLPIIDKVIKSLTGEGVKRFAAVGYCFGGKYVVEESVRNNIHVGATCHPSLLELPRDFNKLLESSEAPLLINSCELDHLFTPELQKIADEMLGDGKYKPGYKRTYYADASHGFGCRADLDNPAEKKAFDESFKEIVTWFKTYL